MRVTLHLLGVEVFDLAFNEPVELEAELVVERCGDALSTPIGFVRSVRPEWDDPGMSRQWDPDESSEDT